LWEWREREEERGALYRSTLRQAAKIHAIEPVALRGLVGGELQPPFDEGLYLWEQGYFFREFASRFSVLTAEELEEVRLGEGLAEVRRTLAALPRRMVHRDFQSQNVIVRDGQAWLIDYQGLRPGRPEYDLASLLYDPYVRLPEGERRELLAYYAGLHGAGEAFGSDAGVFARCACQRLMQALGAYGFLGLVKGKTPFLRHIPVASERLAALCESDPLWQPLSAPVRAAARKFKA
jgi:aminoglycoside/choline kinase family phosphotransferase